MGNKGKATFPKIIEATLAANVGIKNPDPMHGDAAVILESVLAEFSETVILAAIANHGLAARSYRDNLRYLTEVARSRRPKRLAGAKSK